MTLAESTQRSYNSVKIQYAHLCTMYTISPLPLYETTICSYVAHLAKESVTLSLAK